MKPLIPTKKSHRKKTKIANGVDKIKNNITFGETIIPSSTEEVEIILPNGVNTYTYEILKTDALEANLKIACGGSGTFKSLTLRNTGGTLSLEPGVADARLITLNPSLSEASKVDFLSEGNDWYSWGWLVGESLSALETPVYVSPFSNKADDDGDGLSNSQEAGLGTDSGNSDSDGDNVGDGIEVGTGTDPTDSSSSSDPNQDSDGDGVSDFDEITAGTNHLDPTSFPGATESTLPDPSEIGPTFTGIPNNLVIEAGTLEADAKVQALIGVVANDAQDGNRPVSITFAGYTGIHGNTFTATYSATDTDANTTTVTKTFTVEDTVAPVITLNGVNPLTLTFGAIEGNDPGATADDGSPVTSDFATVINNTSAVGEYTITYTSTDAAGNVATPVTRTVQIAEAASGLFIEELQSATDNLQGSATITSGIFNKSTIDTGDLTYVSLDTDGIIQFSGNGASGNSAVNTDFTFSFWISPTNTFGNTSQIMGRYAPGGETNAEFRIRAGQHPTNSTMSIAPILGGMWTSTPGAESTNAFQIGDWYYIVITQKYNISTSKYEYRAYVDGILGGLKLDLTYSLLNAFKNVRIFGIGAISNGGGWAGNSGTFLLDSMQFGDGVWLSDGQIAAMYAQTDRQMTIDEASQLDADAPTLTITRNSDSLDIPDGSSITLNAGEVFEDLYTIEVSDNSGENITPVISPSIDTSSITGPNAHTITATDSAGNSTQITINIEVIGLWTERYENPTGAFYEDLNYSPSGITMVDSLSSNRYGIAAEMTGLTIDMATAALDEGYEVIIDLRPVDTPIRSLGNYNWTDLDQASDCPLMIGFVRAPDTYTWNSANNIPINYSKSSVRDWLAGCFYQARFSEADQNGTQMAYYHNPWDGNAVQSSAYLTWDLNNPGIPATDLIDQVRQVKYIIRRSTSTPNRMYFDIYTKLPSEQSWTELKTGLWAAGPVALHLAIVGKSFPNGSIVQDISIQPWS
jgi:hypothetical protein